MTFDDMRDYLPITNNYKGRMLTPWLSTVRNNQLDHTLVTNFDSFLSDLDTLA